MRIPPIDRKAADAARSRMDRLTKPQGSLGRLEEIAIRVAGMTGRPRPKIERKLALVFVADHGIAAEGVSAYPREVTVQMAANFLAGGAAINVLARHAGATVRVADLGMARPLEHPDLIRLRVGPGTRNFLREPAMTPAEARRCLDAGASLVEEADLIGVGDMGIGNTSSAAAVTAAITGAPVEAVTGRGTGIDDCRLRAKIDAIERALALHRPDAADGLDVLSKVGGFEIGGMAGAMLRAAALRIPVLVDGFISGAAALVASRIDPRAVEYMFAAHRSAEPGHDAALRHLGLDPLLDLRMRLGEGTGAALAMHLVQAACRVLDEMATFGEAGVSEKAE